MEVINAIVPVVSTENVDSTSVDDCSVAVTWTGWLRASVRVKLRPCIRCEVEAVEVIPSIRAVVPAEDVEVIVDCDAGVERARTGRVDFILLRLLDLVPGVHLLQQVLVRATDDIGAVEQGCVESVLLLVVRIPGVASSEEPAGSRGASNVSLACRHLLRLIRVCFHHEAASRVLNY